MTPVTDHQYLSIGEVLGLLLEDFPDVTISKIRFLESQGLIEPERTPSGYRKFYDDDVELLRAILHEQRENFLPLKVIRDRIEAGEIAEAALTRTPPRGIRNVDARPAETERDSVFRRTDGDPTSSMPIPSAASSPSAANTNAHPSASRRRAEEPAAATIAVDHDNGAARLGSTSIATSESTSPTDDASPSVVSPTADAPAPAATRGRTKATKAKPASRRTPLADASGLPFERDQLCAAASITDEQLTQLESYGIVVRRGPDATFAPDTVEIARIAGRFLEQGIDARHLRAWRQSADREAALYEQRIMPLLRQRNPQSRQLAVDSLAELETLGGQLRDALVASTLRHHYDGV